MSCGGPRGASDAVAKGRPFSTRVGPAAKSARGRFPPTAS